MTDLARKRLLVFLVPLFLSLPFLNRAYFVDDSYFVEIATWLVDNPALPYHFRTDDAVEKSRGWEEDGFVRMVNPLAHQYYMALLLKVAGEREWFLRLGCVFLSCFGAIFIFELARRWTEHPVLATLLIETTPVYWLGSYSLLIDPTMAFLGVGSVYWFIRATETGSWKYLLLSGIFMGLAILSKYPAVFVLPLTLAWLVMRWHKVNKRAMFALPGVIGLLFLAGYSWYTCDLYGSPHIIAASKRVVNTFGWPKVMEYFVFLSGAILLPLLVWIVSPIMFVLPMIGVTIGIARFLAGPNGGFTFTQGLLLGLWLSTSALFLAQLVVNRKRWIYPRDWFLIVWLLGFIAMMLLVMDWVAARYYALVLPAVGLLMVRMVEIKRPKKTTVILQAMLVAQFIFTGALAYADYKQADPSRSVRALLKRDGFMGGPRHFYLGDSFTMSYLKRDGWVACFPETNFQKGDWIMTKDVTMPLLWLGKKPVVLRPLAEYNYPSDVPLKVMDFHGSAGYYASVWGALPFTFSSGPWERFRLYEVVDIRPDLVPSEQ